MQIIIRPALKPNVAIDVTETMIDALAQALAEAYGGGNEVLNRLEAEHHVIRLLDARAVHQGGRQQESVAEIRRPERIGRMVR